MLMFYHPEQWLDCLRKQTLNFNISLESVLQVELGQSFSENVWMPSGPVGARGRTQSIWRLSQRGKSSTYSSTYWLIFVYSVRPLAEKQTNL